VEIYHGHELQQAAGENWECADAAIPVPTVHPMAPVPPEGYSGKTDPFDKLYPATLDALNAI
jgi:hypothetical protein